MRFLTTVAGAVTAAAASCTLATASSSPPSYTLLDRTTSLSSGSTEWSRRGAVTIDYATENGFPQVVYQQEKSAIDGLVARQKDDVPAAFHDESWYQVALVPGNGAVVSRELDQLQGQVVNIKECLLEALTPGSFSNDVLTFTLSSNTTQKAHPPHITSFAYDVVGINLKPNGCPVKPIPRKGGGAAKKLVQTKVFTEALQPLSRPSLRTPPPPRADGQAGGEVPPPEKNFLQKYWFYILPVLVLLVIPSDPPAGDGEAATGQGARRVR